MKKSLILAAVALAGIAPSASAVKLMTNESATTDFADGAIIALQCLDNNGGLFYWWDGCKIKNSGNLRQDGLLKVVSNGNGAFVLQDYTNPAQYVKDNGNNAAVVWTENLSEASTWTAEVKPAGGAYATWSTMPDYFEKAQNTVRLTSNSGRFLNTNDKGATPKMFGGTGGYSYWYVYVFTPEEAEALGTTYNPEMIECNFVYDSPRRDGVEYKGMSFKCLDGISLDDCTYLDAYASYSRYFNLVEYDPSVTDKIVSPTNTQFKVNITWNDSWETDFNAWKEKYDNTYSKVHRYWLEPIAADGSLNEETYISYSVIYDGELRAKNPNKLFDPGHMWYLQLVGLDAHGFPLVNMMSVQFQGQGLAVGDNSHVYVSDDPAEFSFHYSGVNGTDDTDFYLGIHDNHSKYFTYLCAKNGTDGVAFFSTVDALEMNAQGQLVRDNYKNCVIRPLEVDASEFDEYEEIVEACGYDKFLEQLNNGVVINESSINDAMSLDPAKVWLIFPENMNLLNGLRTYKDMTGIMYLENEVKNGSMGIPGYVQADAKPLFNALKAFDADDEETWKPVAEARWALVDGTPEISYAISPGAIFTIHNVEKDARGYLVHYNGKLETTTVSGRKRDCDDSEDFQFTFVNVGGKIYMYNIASGKFLNCFGEHTDHAGTMVNNVSDYTWTLSDVPSEIRYATGHSGDAHAFSLIGGMKSGNATGDGYFGNDEHVGGITMLGSYERGVLASYGVNGKEDGTGLLADYIGCLSDEEVDAIAAKAAKTIAAIPTHTTDWSEIEGIVNHVDRETLEKAKAVINTENLAVNGGGHDHVYHIIMTEGARQGFDAAEVYNLYVDGSSAYKYDAETGDFVIADFDDKDASFNVKAVKIDGSAEVYMAGEDDVYSFVHTCDKVNRYFTVDGATEHTLDYSSLGKIKIGDLSLTAKLGSGDAETTSISEVNTSVGAEKYFDLTGRRVDAPANGIYVTASGKKVRL